MFHYPILICSIVLIMCTTPVSEVYTQSSPLDSLQILYVQVDALYDKREYQAAIKLADDALEFGNKNGFPNHQVYYSTELWKAFCIQSLGNCKEALPILEKNTHKLSELNDSTSIAHAARGYNNLGICTSVLGDMQAGLDIFKKMLKKNQQVYGDNHPETAKSYNNLSLNYLNLGEEIQALKMVHHALAINKNVYGEKHINLGFNYYRLGQIYNRRGQYATALQYLQQSLAIRRKNYKPDNPRIATTLDLIGTVLLEEGDHERSLANYEEALAIYRSNYGNDHIDVANELINIGRIYLELNDLDRAFEFTKEAEEIYLRIVGEGNYKLAAVYENLGILESTRKNLPTAIKYFNLGKEVALSTLGNKASELSRHYLNIAEMYLDFNQLDNAAEAFQQGIVVATEIWGKDAPQATKMKANLGWIYAQQNDFTQAKNFIAEAITDLKFDPTSTQPYDAVPSLAYLTEVLSIKVDIYQLFYHKENDLTDLKLALQTIEEIDALYKFRRTGYKESGAGLSLSKEAVLSYETGLEICHQLWSMTGEEQYLKKAFDLMESSKIQVLLTALRTVGEQLSFAGIPDSLIQEQEDYELRLYQLEQDLFNATESDSIGTVLQKEIFALKQEYYQFQDKMENDFPAYQQLKYDTKTIPLDRVRTLSDNKNTAIIEYFLGDSSLYTLVIQPQHTDFYQLPLPNSFRNELSGYLQLLHHPGQVEQAAFLAQQQRFSQLLLAQSLSDLSESISHLVLIPDDILAYIPFESLAISDDSNKYLLEKYNIAYARSATLLERQLNDTGEKAPERLAGFAPDYQNLSIVEATNFKNQDLELLVRSGEYQLPGAVQEVTKITELTAGIAFIGEDATEQNFKKRAADFNILHLSMHSLFDDEHPLFSKLLFTPPTDSIEDGYLHAAELYNLPLQAQLAILSACNTGFGKPEKGEGIMNLSRAFTYAGVPATIMSLWQVPDQATAKIMIAFYQHLQSGMTKDAALRQAKLDYLKNTIEPDQRHPYYWAGFVAEGNMQALDLNPTRYWSLFLYGLLAILGVGIGVLYWRKR